MANRISSWIVIAHPTLMLGPTVGPRLVIDKLLLRVFCERDVVNFAQRVFA